MDCKYNLGDTVRDTITGFQGVVIGRSQWLNGCVTYQLQGTALDKDGMPQKPCAFDEPQLEYVSAVQPKARGAQAGGPTRETGHVASGYAGI